MRGWIAVALAAAVVAWPVAADGPLTIVAPAAPGGGWDQTARAMQQVLGLVDPGAPVQVENVAGAAGTIGLARFVRAERGNPDALLVTGLVMVSAAILNDAPVSLADTTPIARLTGEYEVIVVPAGSPYRTLRDLLAAFRPAPEAISWGGGSAGGTDDLLVRLMADAIGVPPARVNYIAFPGGGAALAALLGGQVTAGVSGYGEFAGQIEAGTLRLLAVSAPARVEAIAAPTLRDEGVDLDLANWRGVVAPPGLSDVEQHALVARVERLAASDAWRATLARYGWEDMLLTGPPFRQFLLAEQQRVTAVLARLRSAADSEGRASRAGSGRRLSPTPMTAPIAALVGLAAIALVVWRRERRTAALPRRPGHPWRLALVLGAHAVLFPILGFVAASTALFIAVAALFGSRRWLRNVTIGFAVALLLFAVFTAGLGLSLPPDPITRWRRG